MNDDDWDFFNKSVGKLEKEVITLKKENERLKENIHSMLFTDDVVQNRYDKAKEENTKLKELLRECKRQFEEVELCRYDVADTDQEDWFKISTEQAGIANKMIAKIDEVLK